MESPDFLPPHERPPLPEDRSLLARLDRVLGARYTAFVIIVACVLALSLALAATAQGASSRYGGRPPGMLGLAPAILVYILMVHPSMHRRWHGAMQSLEVLAPSMAGASISPPKSRRGEWAAMLAGSLAGLALAHRLPGADGWLRLYYETTSTLAFALLATVIHGSVVRSRQLALRMDNALQVSVFDRHLLTPFAQRGQSLTLVFVGGISLSLLFQSYASLRSLESAIVYSCLVVVALTLFFMSVWTVHVALSKARDEELVIVRRDLAAARQVLQRHRAGGFESVSTAYAPVVTLAAYERQVLEAPTWPFNSAIVGRVFASAAAPLGVYLIKLAVGLMEGT